MPRFALVALAVLAPGIAMADTRAGALVYYLDEHYHPMVRLDRLPQPSGALRGILAMYALQNGGGCDRRSPQGLECKLTESLGLGPQCSSRHLAEVRRLFIIGMPKMSGGAPHLYASAGEPGVLEALCYGQPDTASRQRTWSAIRVKVSGESVAVQALGNWMTPYGNGRFGYQTEYDVSDGKVSVVSHRELRLQAGQQ